MLFMLAVAKLKGNQIKNVIVMAKTNKQCIAHPGSGSDRTIASVRQVTALAMLYIGRLVTCGY